LLVTDAKTSSETKPQHRNEKNELKDEAPKPNNPTTTQLTKEKIIADGEDKKEKKLEIKSKNDLVEHLKEESECSKIFAASKQEEVVDITKSETCWH
jgi:hypothetical protein